MKSRTVNIILCLGGILLMSGLVAFLAVSSRLTQVNGEIENLMQAPNPQHDRIWAATQERDILASRMPWAIGTAFIGGICGASGAFLKIREQLKDDNIPPK
jgi:hypothetical protein